MTKYILHGGAITRKTEENKKFYSEIVKSLSDDANILCVYFSREKKLWAGLFEEDKFNFSVAAPEKVFNFVLADDQIDNLVGQIKKADAIYIFGGNTDNIKAVLGKVENLKELLKGKVVAGESAGINVLSVYFYSNRLEKISAGLGVLPIKTFCHYTEDKTDKLEELKNYGEDLKVYALSEEKFVVIEEK